MIHKSPYPKIQIPEEPLSHFLLQRAQIYRDKPALIEPATGRTLTYRNLIDQIRRAASGLHKSGFGKGDVFAIYLPNMLEYAIALHAVILLGGTITPINPLFTSEELAKQLRDAGATRLLTIRACASKVAEALPNSNVHTVYFADPNYTGADSFHSLLKDPVQIPDVEINVREQIAALPYSSGTTGFPKGVMLTHYNLVANIHQIDLSEIMHGDDRVVCVLPFFHIYGLVVIMNESILLGATTVILPRFDLEHMLLAMQEYRVTMAPVVPPIVLAFAKSPVVSQYDLSSLRYLFSAAAPLSAKLGEECENRLKCEIKQGYGMTEASPATHMTPHRAELRKPGSVGFPVSNTECKVINAAGDEAGAGEAGEIWIRGPQVMKGYLNCPDATAQAITSDGWLRSGDIGYADADGHFFIVDRVKEMIKYKGFQIAPAELEATLLTHPQIADAAVIPIADEEAGEVPKAYVVLKSPVTSPEILQYVAERVAPYKKIRRLEVVDQIPKSPSGKILRRVLIERNRA